MQRLVLPGPHNRVGDEEIVRRQNQVEHYRPWSVTSDTVPEIDCFTATGKKTEKETDILTSAYFLVYVRLADAQQSAQVQKQLPPEHVTEHYNQRQLESKRCDLCDSCY